ncbi:MAG TPA: MmcQ/YjbR family DNA-binding protein [Dehalococcoidia bacterium]|nr:MmcQ/YjbR family DNA-binding protein [Dehalococcoidia bacterium]
MVIVARRPIDRVRAICLALPEATEKQAWGEATFRVAGRIFAQYEDHHHGSDLVGLWCKAPDGLQAFLVTAEPARFYVPKYVGHRGWIGIRMDGAVDWPHVAALITDSYRMLAPARLVAALDTGGDPSHSGPRVTRSACPPKTSSRSNSRASPRRGSSRGGGSA